MLSYDVVTPSNLGSDFVISSPSIKLNLDSATLVRNSANAITVNPLLLDSYLTAAEIGIPGGVAPLGLDGKVPAHYLPPGNAPYPVTSVNTLTGDVRLTTDQIPEGVTNLYFTPNRVIGALANQVNGVVFSTPAPPHVIFYTSGYSSIYYLCNAIQHWDLNITYSGAESLASHLEIGTSRTIKVLVPNGGLVYRLISLSIDGTPTNVFWKDRIRPTEIGCSVNCYTFEIYRISLAEYSVFGSLSVYA